MPPVTETVRIPARFNGPPTTGHGGYSSGAVAALLGPGAGPVAVSLRAPPPLDVDLTVAREGARVTVFDGDRLVAIANPGQLSADAPDAVGSDVARDARHDPEALMEIHPFPTCFGCGPARSVGDGLRLFAGRVAGDSVFAVPWEPPAELADDDGLVEPIFVWSALDCPSGAPADAGTGGEAVVLARYLVELEAPVRAGEPHVIVSSLIRRDGRKRSTAMALYDERGRRLARGEALWVKLG